MGRGGPPEPQRRPARHHARRAARDRTRAGGHAASDYLEDAALAGVPTVGLPARGRRASWASRSSRTCAEGAALAASLDPDAILFEGSGACIPPVEVDRTVCVVGQGADALHGLGELPPAARRLALAMGGDRELAAAIGGRFCPALACELVPEPVEPLPDGARVALFTTSAARLRGRRAGGGLVGPRPPRPRSRRTSTAPRRSAATST